MTTSGTNQSTTSRTTMLTKQGGFPFLFRIVEFWGGILARVSFLPTRSRWLAVWTFVSLPLVLLAIPPWEYSVLTGFWAIWLAVCNAAMLLFSWRIWNALMDSHKPVQEMLSGLSRDSLSRLEEWYRKGFRNWPQLCAALSGGVAISITALRLPESIVERVPVTLTSLAFAGIVSGHCLYFIIYTALFCRKISLLPKLRMIWNDPIRTPGIVALSRATQLQAQLGLMLFFLIAVPLTYGYTHAPAPGIRILYLLCMALPLLCIAVIGLVIQGWLAEPARNHKQSGLEEISVSIETLLAGRTIDGMRGEELIHLKERLDIYNVLEATRDSFLRGEVISQYLTSIAAALLPFIVAFLLR